MRFPIETIREKILSEDREVREFAVAYFSRSGSRDPLVFDYVLQAFEKFGLEGAFGLNTFDDELHLTSDSFAKVLDILEKSRRSNTEPARAIRRELSDLLTWADADLLGEFESPLRKARFLDDECRARILERLDLRKIGPEECWAELGLFAEQAHKHRAIDFDRITMLTKAMKPHKQALAERVLELLARKIDENSIDYWLEYIAIELAGELNIQESVPLLVNKLFATRDMMPEELENALRKIGTDEVTELLKANYARGSSHCRYSVATILERIKSDKAAKTCLELLLEENDADVKTILALSLLNQWWTESLIPVQKACSADVFSRKSYSVDKTLVVAAKAMEVSLPEFEEWSAAMKEQNDAWRKSDKNIFAMIGRELETLSGLFAEILTADQVEVPSPSLNTQPVVDLSTATRPFRAGARVGRNEPCPCGSGKKFKKCCLKVGTESSVDSIRFT